MWLIIIVLLINGIEVVDGWADIVYPAISLKQSKRASYIQKCPYLFIYILIYNYMPLFYLYFFPICNRKLDLF